MNLRFVEAFYWTVSLRSITRAAQKLHITQSALSSRITSLEDELGVLLLDRRDKQFRLTAAGQRFHSFAQRMLELQREVKSELGNATAPLDRLRIGAIESVVHSWLTGWLQNTRQAHPDFELELTVETTPVLLEHLHRGNLDLIFAARPAVDSFVRSRALPPMAMSFVGHKVLHARRHYSAQDLFAHDIMTFQCGSQPHTALQNLLQESHIRSARVHAISSISAMVQLIEGGFGIATLPKATIARLSKRSPLRMLKTSCDMAPLPIHASHRDDPTSLVAVSALESALHYIETLA